MCVSCGFMVFSCPFLILFLHFSVTISYRLCNDLISSELKIWLECRSTCGALRRSDATSSKEWKRSHCHKTRSHSGKSCCNKKLQGILLRIHAFVCDITLNLQLRLMSTALCLCRWPYWGAHMGHTAQWLQFRNVSLFKQHFLKFFEWGIEYRPEWKQFGTGFLFSGLIWSGSSTVLLDRTIGLVSLYISVV